VFTFLTILGSLGVFLYGMKVLSEGIQKSAGERLRQIMATMTKTRFSGLFTGFLATIMLQSSSVTTVITVSFVNAGLLTLVESIGVIMGANLGTTLTAWIIAFVPNFNLGAVALPLIGIGITLFFVFKDRTRSVGETLIGFGLVFLGLVLLKDAVPNVREAMATDPEFTTSVKNLVTMLSGYGFFSILLFVILGAILTVCVQSSSAAMAITITLAANGWIGFEMSAAIILGENIGTTITAWLASIGANANAKRTSRIHFLFNTIGVCWMLIVFPFYVKFIYFLVDKLPDAMRTTEAFDSDLAFGLALFHSIFNLLNIMLLIGFTPLLAKISMRWIKDPEGDLDEQERLRFISQRIVDVGELNLPEAESAVRKMAGLNLNMMEKFIKIFKSAEEDRSAEVIALRTMERRADQMLSDITTYLVRSSTRQLSERHAHSISAMLQVVSEMEQVADCISRLVKFTRKKYRKDQQFRPEVVESLTKFAETIHEFITFYHSHLFRTVNDSELKYAKTLEKTTDQMRKAIRKDATARMKKGGDVQAEMLTIDMAVQLERIGNHALNIVEACRFIDSDNLPDYGPLPPSPGFLKPKITAPPK